MSQSIGMQSLGRDRGDERVEGFRVGGRHGRGRRGRGGGLGGRRGDRGRRRGPVGRSRRRDSGIELAGEKAKHGGRDGVATNLESS